MTEREKMLAGQLYDCGDAELLTQWHKAKDLTRDYNKTDSADAQEKERILTELLGGKGKNLWITAPFFVDYGNNIYFGNNCEVNMNCTFLDDNIIRIGDNALIAPNVQIYTAYHPRNAFDRFGEPKEDGSFEFCKTQTAPVIIGDNSSSSCWRWSVLRMPLCWECWRRMPCRQCPLQGRLPLWKTCFSLPCP